MRIFWNNDSNRKRKPARHNSPHLLWGCSKRSTPKPDQLRGSGTASPHRRSGCDQRELPDDLDLASPPKEVVRNSLLWPVSRPSHTPDRRSPRGCPRGRGDLRSRRVARSGDRATTLLFTSRNGVKTVSFHESLVLVAGEQLRGIQRVPIMTGFFASMTAGSPGSTGRAAAVLKRRTDGA